MKKLFLLFAVAGASFFASCDKDELSLAGTRWVNDDFFDDRSLVSELTFTANSVTLVLMDSDGSVGSSRTGTYTYDPPLVYMEIDGIYPGEPATIEGNIMTVAIISGDIVMPLDFIMK